MAERNDVCTDVTVGGGGNVFGDGFIMVPLGRVSLTEDHHKIMQRVDGVVIVSNR